MVIEAVERARPTKHATLCMIVKDGKILLGMKKRGFGAGKYNGYGGKPQAGESIDEAALRELQEESSLEVSMCDLEKIGEIDFHFPHNPSYDQTVHIYNVLKFSGAPVESEEMSHHWFPLDQIPYHSMWDDDKHWLPHALDGKKVQGYFIFKESGKENVVHENGLQVVYSLTPS